MAEITRSVYIAASDPEGDDREYPQPWSYAPAMIRNSPANVAEPGTARAIIPATSTTVASVGRPRSHASERIEVTGATPSFDHPDEEEHARGDEPVRDGLEHCAVEPEVVECEDADRDEPHLRHRRVRDHTAQVGGSKREQRAVDESGAGEDEDEPREIVGGLGNFGIPIARSRRSPSSRRPRSTAATSTGASRYASGSQPWNGNSGAFTAKATAKPRKIRRCRSSRIRSARTSPVTPNATTDASISSEPAIV